MYDLLAPATQGRPEESLALREEPSGAVYALGARSLPLHSAADALSALAVGAARMKLAASSLGRPQARSHSVCIVEVSRRPSEAARRDAAAAAAARPTTGAECVRVSLRAANRDSESSRVVNVRFSTPAASLAPTLHNLASRPAGDLGDGALNARERSATWLQHTLELAQRTHTALRGRLTMVDLAGSERVAAGKGLKSPAGQSAGVQKVRPRPSPAQLGFGRCLF